MIKGSDACNRIEVYQDWTKLASVDCDDVKNGKRTGLDLGWPNGCVDDTLGAICDTEWPRRRTNLACRVRGSGRSAGLPLPATLVTKGKERDRSRFKKKSPKCR